MRARAAYIFAGLFMLGLCSVFADGAWWSGARRLLDAPTPIPTVTPMPTATPTPTPRSAGRILLDYAEGVTGMIAAAMRPSLSEIRGATEPEDTLYAHGNAHADAHTNADPGSHLHELSTHHRATSRRGVGD